MKNSKLSETITEGISWVLAFLFAYTALSKIYDWKATKTAFYNQAIPDWSKEVILYVIPGIEILISVFLLLPKLRKTGLFSSMLLMGIFTGYVALVWIGWTAKIPCSCGGVLESFSWGEHLLFNLVILMISIMGYWLSKNQKV
ncbi:hypothetical protein PBT90_11030 [Algoriphagus halophytocola]|uniref:Methylamine utilisation protein MauE domain-containing protein n=1 Tax=Algoriphagus halophytocola TaxID=2991499 RepID=A0ABY6MNM0_9BACT|nr:MULTISPECIES: MauE/DoxX family redox-associated membrane protein [unclassified Algoriphagus]UZD23921.1 hypothetical protein OM944_05370 [Algoriphagus sp. TR-M5]WBL41289.1 hypothetical protein PBT90_11030 [Algoriphagus sp. TR-M9]